MGDKEQKQKRGRRDKTPAGKPLPKIKAAGSHRDRTMLLLAKIISLLLGFALGFYGAFLANTIFTPQLLSDIDNSKRSIRDLTQELNEAQAQHDQSLREVRNARDDLNEFLSDDSNLSNESSQGSTPPPLEPEAQPESGAESDTEINTGTADAEEGSESGMPASEAAFESKADTRSALQERLSQAEDVRNKLASLIEVLERSINEAELDLADAERNLAALQLLSLLIILVCGAACYMLYPLTLKLLLLGRRQMQRVSGSDIQLGPHALIGFISGMVVALIFLLALFSSLSIENTLMTNTLFRLVFGTIVVMMLGVAGAAVGNNYFNASARRSDPFADYRRPSPPKIIDTSVLIDGRIHEVANSGFLGGMLVVTNSVLRELQALSDSADDNKRSKGRRGLELLRKMQDDPRVEVEIFDDSEVGSPNLSTDEQLIEVAQAMGGLFVTNDFNLNRVAAIRDVRVLNLNALANSVKANHVPGDYLDIDIIDKGKQKGQGVGYLGDGTMVVVEDGEPYIGQHKTLRLTSISQTVQGRLLFGRVDAVESGGRH